MTGLAETEHIVHGLEAGGVDYVTKPIVIEEMLARIRVHLANARLTQSARAALDVSGRFLLAVSRQGKIMWATPQAQKLLSDNLAAGSDDEFVLPDSMLQWLEQAQKGKTGRKPRRWRRFRTTSSFGCNIWASSVRMNSCCGWPRSRAAICRAIQQRTRPDQPRGRSAVVAVERKTNRDIAQILVSAQDRRQASRADLRQARRREPNRRCRHRHQRKPAQFVTAASSAVADQQPIPS